MEDNITEEFWFVDSWGWASSRNPDTMKFDRNLGHIKNCLKFLGGPQPRWYDPYVSETCLTKFPKRLIYSK